MRVFLASYLIFVVVIIKVALASEGTAIKFTEEDISNALMGHNHYRTHNATPVASNMRKITWDDELAAISSRWSTECKYQMNPDAVVERFGNLGQSFFLSKKGVVWEKDFHFMAVAKWLWPQRNYDYNRGSCKKDAYCLEYLNLMAANTYKIGCGASNCPDMRPEDPEEGNVIFYSCAYAPIAVYNSTHFPPPYSAGEPCEACEANDTCSEKMCTNEARDATFEFEDPNAVDDQPKLGGLIGGAAAGVATLIGIISSVLLYLKKFRKILPDDSVVSETPTDERGATGDGNSRPSTPMVEAKFREAEANLPSSPKVATVEPLQEKVETEQSGPSREQETSNNENVDAPK